ncbi:MAG: tRNA uridine-5-carboxymethylaminomethyl(34) synthesis GTPase MnmE [Candidatus Zixiibacteriota bacterium]|nr:MAG: tRNA uridine-5-carboxymethylaminomethyl(34) synthesis GTPase MnmE [candidate division Zixibacteria bacterium]
MAAIITPPGEGGLGAIRIAGPDSARIIEKIFRPAQKDTELHRPFHLYYGFLTDRSGETIDEVTTVEMPPGQSYTGQAQAEIFSHGGQYILRKILAEILSFGVRPAEPGEFTRRAFLAGRIDLAKAEAVADLIASKTEYAYNAAKRNLLGRLSEHVEIIRNEAIELLSDIEASVDYPEEDFEAADREKLFLSVDSILAGLKELRDSYRSGRIIREGYAIAIAGRPNAGKSSLFNLLLNQNRAIVAPIPGTTRDYLIEWIDLDGIAVSLTDTAGLRNASGVVEKAGQRSAEEIMESANLVIWIVDATRRLWRQELSKDVKQYQDTCPIIVALNKIDLLKTQPLIEIKAASKELGALPLSCKTGAGLTRLRKELMKCINCEMPDLTDRLVVTSERHKRKLELAMRKLRRARKGIAEGRSPEMVAFDFRQGINEIDEITGRIYNEDILDRIFARFCIGK